MSSFGIFTTSRADFSIIEPMVKKLQNSRKHKSYLFVGGSHLLKKFGESVNEIKKNKIKITSQFNYFTGSSEKKNIIKNFSNSIIKINSIFEKYNFEYVIINGDRYELISVVMNSIIYNKKIIHLSGGEETTGAIDNQIRNMISKCASYHFVSNKLYQKNLNKMNIKKNIFLTGSLDFIRLDKINRKKINKKYFFKKYNLDINKKLALLTYHPETNTISKISYHDQIKLIIDCLKIKKYQIILTGGNLDPGIDGFFKYLESKKNMENISYYSALGSDNYLSLMKFADLVIGNSSSGIAESPFFKVPTINIGTRQKGRIIHKNILNCDLPQKNIIDKINKVSTLSFKKKIKNIKYKFGDKKVLSKIMSILSNIKKHE